MTEAEEQELFARVERLERSAWRWRWFASALAVLSLLLGSLGVVSAVAFRVEAVTRARESMMEAKRARDEADMMRQRAADERQRAMEA